MKIVIMKSQQSKKTANCQTILIEKDDKRMGIEHEFDLECPNCHRILNKKYFIKHHAIPRQKGGSHSEKITLCQSCGQHLHNLYPNSILKKDLNTLEKIINDPGMKNFGEWIGKRNIIRIRHTNKGGFHK